MKNKFKKQGRVWLSDEWYESGAIIHHVEVGTFAAQDEKPKYLEASVVLRDCNRTVQLDFDSYSKEAYQRRLDKITTLINELTEFKMNLMDAAALCADGWREAENESDDI